MVSSVLVKVAKGVWRDLVVAEDSRHFVANGILEGSEDSRLKTEQCRRREESAGDF